VSRTNRIGVLALQGDFEAHVLAITAVGGQAVEIRRIEQLRTIDGLILPGGESTVLLRLMGEYGFDQALPAYHETGGFLYGTCAGLILLAREVIGPPQRSLGLLNVTVRRNAYGRQVDSFVDTGSLRWNGGDPEPAEMVFIRAPRIEKLGEGVETIGELLGVPTLVRHGRIWGGTFHPELSKPFEIHRRFIAEATA
jgi:pyridoxal 5'-phosphate synthase pdxT subunit